MSTSNLPKNDYPIAADDAERINRLKKYQVLNNNEEPAFARLTELAKLFFNMPIITITFMDEDTQYLKSGHGLGGVCTTTRKVAICNYTILSDEVFVVAMRGVIVGVIEARVALRINLSCLIQCCFLVMDNVVPLEEGQVDSPLT